MFAWSIDRGMFHKLIHIIETWKNKKEMELHFQSICDMNVMIKSPRNSPIQ